MSGGSFVCQSPAFAVEGDVTLKVGERVRFLVAMPEDDIEIGDEGYVRLIHRSDDTSVFIETGDDRGCIVVEDHELWKIERRV